MNPSILVLANLPEAAEPTARYAAALGALLPVRLTLLHLEVYPVMLQPELMAAMTAQAERTEASTMAGLRALAHRLPVPTEVAESSGILGDAVADAVQQYQPLLLAMGLSTEEDFLDRFLVNQLLPLLRDTHRPLLLVPHLAQVPGRPRRVLVAVDAEPFAPNAASRALVPLLASWQAAYTMTHVQSAAEALTQPGQRALNDLQASGLLPPGAPLWLHQETHESAAAGVRQAIADTQADLLVLIARPRSFLGRLFHRSVTAQLLRNSSIPVLLLPAEE